MRLRKTQTAASYEKRKRFPPAMPCVCVCGKARLIVALRALQNRERTGVPARAARVGWWMRPGHKLNLSGAFGQARCDCSSPNFKDRIARMSDKRFRIAFSFAGEKRDFVAQVAAILARRFGEPAILYDKYHEAEFARYDLGIYLPKLYRDESDLVVAVLCPEYDQKPWTGWEWMAIHAQLTKKEGS